MHVVDGGESATHMSSSGEMKMSLRLMTWHIVRDVSHVSFRTAHILVPQMLEELQFSVCSLGEDGGAEGLHDLLDGYGLAGELVLGRTTRKSVPSMIRGL